MQPGTILKKRYRILQLIGSSNFGETYLGEDSHVPGNPRCVVKHLQPKTNDPKVMSQTKRLFEREANVLYKLGRMSDRIPSLGAHFEEGGEFYLVQEYIQGHDLGKEIRSGTPLSESYARALLAQILEVLEVVHGEGVIHRDIKPQNLMRRDKDGKIVLIDFGAVKEEVANAGEGGNRTIVGTPGYMPIEQSKGKPKLSSDIYAVGIIGIQALTGLLPVQLPEEPNTGEVVWRNQVSVSDELGDFLDRMVRDRSSKRFSNAMEARLALVPQTVVSLPRVGAPPSSQNSSAVTPPNAGRRKFLWWLALGGLGFAGAVAIKFLLGDPPPLPSPPPPEPPPPPKVTTTQSFTTVKVNPLGETIESRQGEAKVLTENLSRGVTLEMVSIPGGSFLMGSPENLRVREEDEIPQHDVNVPRFFFGKYPVTQAQYQAVMGNNPSDFKGPNRPVENITWNDATEFCQKLSQRTGKTYRLPSEAEWEYACRAGTTTPFYFGETITTELANYNGSYAYGSGPEGVYREETTDVGSFPPNAFGLYDMHGNVWEWCQDVLHGNYNGAPRDGSAWVSGGDDSRRIIRGGSWLSVPSSCRSANRFWHNPSDWRGLRGFRVVLDLGV